MQPGFSRQRKVVFLSSTTICLFIAQSMPENKRVRVVTNSSFICSAAISAEFGLSLQRSSAISFFNAVMDSSKKNIGLFPKEKIGFDSIVSICPAERLDMFITDWDVMEEDLNLFREKGIHVIVVDEE